MELWSCSKNLVIKVYTKSWDILFWPCSIIVSYSFYYWNVIFLGSGKQEMANILDVLVRHVLSVQSEINHQIQGPATGIKFLVTQGSKYIL